MNSIIGFSELLNEPDLSTEKIRHFTNIIIQSCKQLLSIIDDIINIATVEAGQARVNESCFELNLMLGLTYHQLLLKTPKHIELSLKLPSPDKIYLNTDKVKLGEIITNLVSNAIKFTKEGSIDFGYHINEDKLEFFVKDTGIGIPPEMHNEVFKRFRRLEPTGTNILGGTGLGLSISKAYVELLGGKIWLDSQPGIGSTFFFTLPYKPIQQVYPSENHQENSLLPNIEQTKTILIAEDTDLNFSLLKEYLAGERIKIIRATNGVEAIDICKSNHHIDLVLMDLKMPVIDGYEATMQIKKFRPELPVIAQTAYASESDRMKALACGCSDSITKPINREQLITTVSKYLMRIKS